MGGGSEARISDSGTPISGGRPQALELPPSPPQSPRAPGPATRPAQASQPRDGSRDRKCPPAQTAPPFPAAPSPRAGPQAPDPRARVAAAAGRGDPSAAAILGPCCGPFNSWRCGAKTHTKGRGALPESPLPAPSTLFAGAGKASAHPKAPDAGAGAPKEENSKASPWELQGRPNHPAAGAPGRTTLKLWAGHGDGEGEPQKRGNEDLAALSLFLQNALCGWPGAAPAWPGLPAPPPGPARPPGAPEPSRARRWYAVGPRPLPRRARAARSTHLGRAALPAGLRRAR